MMDNGLKKFVAHDVKPQFDNDLERQKAYKQVFGSEIGSKVLADMMLKAGWFKAYIPNGSRPDNASQAMFDHGKKYPFYDVLQTMSIRFEEVKLDASFDYHNPQPLEEY